MSVDIIAALVAFLKADGPTAALVSTRVFGIELPEAEAAAMSRKAVVIQPSGGAPLAGGYVDHTAQRVDAVSYGETPFEADKVERAVFDALKNLRRQVQDNVLIHWIEDAGGYASGRDADTDWPFDARSFQVFFARTATP